MSNVGKFPATVKIDLGQPRSIGRAVTYSGPPWQWQGTLLDYELQIKEPDGWRTIEHVKEPPQTFKVFTPPTRTSVDSFASDRWIFEHAWQPTATDKVRLLVHEVTWGGGATEDVAKAGGQTGLIRSCSAKSRFLSDSFRQHGDRPPPRPFSPVAAS